MNLRHVKVVLGASGSPWRFKQHIWDALSATNQRLHFSVKLEVGLTNRLVKGQKRWGYVILGNVNVDVYISWGYQNWMFLLSKGITHQFDPVLRIYKLVHNQLSI